MIKKVSTHSMKPILPPKTSYYKKGKRHYLIVKIHPEFDLTFSGDKKKDVIDDVLIVLVMLLTEVQTHKRTKK